MISCFLSLDDSHKCIFRIKVIKQTPRPQLLPKRGEIIGLFWPHPFSTCPCTMAQDPGWRDRGIPPHLETASTLRWKLEGILYINPNGASPFETAGDQFQHRSLSGRWLGDFLCKMPPCVLLRTVNFEDNKMQWEQIMAVQSLSKSAGEAAKCSICLFKTPFLGTASLNTCLLPARPQGWW